MGTDQPAEQAALESARPAGLNPKSADPRAFGEHWAESASVDEEERPRGFYLWVLVAIAGGGLVPLCLYVDSASAFGAGVLASAAAFFTGSIAGFVFGIPRSADGESHPRWAIGQVSEVQSVPTRVPYRANTNLEQISDWLTKILVGVGLTQFRAIGSTVVDMADDLGVVLAAGNRQSGGQVALTLFVLYFATGFLFFYLWTRLYLPELFQVAERKAEAVLHRRLRRDEDLRIRLRSGEGNEP